jgi:hypothetical protein
MSSKDAIVSKSSILQARLDKKENKQKSQAAANMPIVNVVLPNNILSPFGLLNATSSSTLQTQTGINSLVPDGYEPGPKITITEFCVRHGLSKSILERFNENAFTGTQAFRHMQEVELRTMLFKPGEIADIKDAIETWAIKIN